MKNSTYWKDRFVQLENASNSYGQDAFRQIEPAFERAEREIQAKIESWYLRIAKNNEVSIAEARRLLSARELDEFKWDIKEYIKYGQENEFNDIWTKELENASAKFHISRLDAMKVHTQQALEKAFSNELDYVDAMARRVYSEGYYHSCYEIQWGFNIGWDVANIDDARLDKLIAKPWAADGKNFSSRVWQSKISMVNELHQEMVRTCVLGKAPDEAINHMSKYVKGKFSNAKNQAGRLVMTEQAFFSSAAQKDAFSYLGVEQFEFVATLDSKTSTVCQDMDGNHYPMKDYEPGVTAPPLHVWCRSCTCPYFDDDFSLGDRAARDKNGKTCYVSDDLKYKDWKKKFVQEYEAEHGDGSYGVKQLMDKNLGRDKIQHKKYVARLGSQAPKSFKSFQDVKYNSPQQWAQLKLKYADKGIQLRIQSDTQNKTIWEGDQGKHIIGHNNYIKGRSYITMSIEEAQQLVNRYAGTGKLKRSAKGMWVNKETIYSDRIIGYNVSMVDGTETPTKAFNIHYSKKGVHIVPTKE